MYPKKLVLILIILAVSGSSAFAQGFFKKKFLKSEYIEVGAHTGAATHIGELNEQVFGFNEVDKSWNVGASVKQYFASTSSGDRTWGVRLDLNYTQINGSGPEPNAPYSSKPDEHLHFSNKIHELALLGEFHFWEFRPTRERSLITPYVFAGIGGIYHHPKTSLNGSKVSMINELVEINDPEYRTDTLGNDVLTGFNKPSKWVASIPFGAGLKYNFSGPLTLALEVNYRYAFSDFLDGIGSGDYLDYEKINNKLPEDPKLTQAEWESLVAPSTKNGAIVYRDLIGRPRGRKGNDLFMTTVFKATWTFYKWRDPSWR